MEPVQVGSWMYMAPEMVTSHHYTEKVDVFAMSVMLYEALKCRLNVTRIAIGGEPGALKEYADTVASGTSTCLVQTIIARGTIIQRKQVYT